ncbi:MAG TPA: hypothetical protein VMV12_05695 [Candidatus Micrarchaeaceae archaeon]|nr:hypothetical protein [Candidatus Micrarchaeaceae archaeon]
MRHRHRDLYIPIVPALGLGFLSAFIAVPSARISGMWAVTLLGAGIACLGIGVYVAVALIRGFWLPGGFEGTFVATESDEQLGRECLSLAQAMSEMLAEAQRDAPPYRVGSGEATDRAEHYKQWQEASERRQVHEQRVVARFLDHFVVRLASVLQALRTRGVLTEEEQRDLWWTLSAPMFHQLPRLPEVLSEKARQIGVKP